MKPLTHIEMMGRAIRLEADDEQLLAAALEALGCARATRDNCFQISLSLRLGTDGDADDEVQIEVDGRRLTLAGYGARGEADGDLMEARCQVPRAFLRNPKELRAELLEPLLLFLLTRSGLTPVHASAFRLEDTAVLLAGPSGSGKSSLALACLKAGLPIISDDTVYVEVEPDFRIWGGCDAIHLLPENAPAGRDGVRWRGGRLKDSFAIPSTQRATCARRAILCVLERGDSVALEPIAPASARQALSRFEPGFDLLEAEVSSAIAVLAEQGAWRLRLSNDPGEAVSLLLETFAVSSRRAE